MIDNLGLYVETNSDGGDCPHRTGTMIGYKAITGQNASQTIDAVLKNLTASPNVYFRYPIQWNQPSDFSRDQASRLMLGFALAGRSDLVSAYYKLVLKNGLKHPNGDYLGIGEVVNLIRGVKNPILYLPALIILQILDLKFAGDLIARKINPWGYDALMCEDLYWTKTSKWTLAGLIIRKIYKQTDAKQQIWNNLIDPKQNGCIEAGLALQDVMDRM